MGIMEKWFELNLFGPNKTIYHRVGMLGIASTLMSIEELGLTDQIQLPGSWNINEKSIEIFCDKNYRKEFMKKLYNYAFQLQDECFYFPGQSPFEMPDFEIRAKMTELIGKTFYCGRGGSSKQGKGEISLTIDDEIKTIKYEKYSEPTHKKLWEDILDDNKLKIKNIEFGSVIIPGFTDNYIHGTPKLDPLSIFCFHFFLVGSQLFHNKILILPEIKNLKKSLFIRDSFYPKTYKDCFVNNCFDAILEMKMKIKQNEYIEDNDLLSCESSVMSFKNWNGIRPINSKIIRVDNDEVDIDLFEKIYKSIAPRFSKEGNYFYSNLRSLFSENIINNEKFYKGFYQFLIQEAKKNQKKLSEILKFNKKILERIVDIMKNEESFSQEQEFVETIQNIMRNIYGKAAQQSMGDVKKTINNKHEQIVRDIKNAKSCEKFRNVMADLLSQSNVKMDFKNFYFFLEEENWKLGRDLTLIAIGSYTKKEEN